MTDKELRKLQAQHPTENDPMPFAKAVIAAFEAKLREQDPVAFYDGNKFYANEESAICGCADMAKLKPVFTHLAPIPEVVALKSEIESLRISYDAACMLVAQLHEAVMGEVVGPHHGVVEDVRNKVAEQAAAIEYLADKIVFDSMNTSLHEWRNICKVARIARTDSKQILAEWLDKQLGEPVAWESESEGLTYENHYSDNVPLFKKPEKP